MTVSSMVAAGTRLLIAGAALEVALSAAVGVREAYRVFHPPRTAPRRSPADRDLTVRTGCVRTTRDGLRLATWTVPGAGPDTVVLCHGLGRNREMLLPHIRMLHVAGYHVVAYDLRNHGESDRDRALGFMADRFVADLRDVVLASRDDAEISGGRIAVLALSLSTWPALHLLADPGAPVAAVISDSGPTLHITTGFRRFYTVRRGLLPRPLRHEPGFTLSRLAYEAASLSMLAVRGWPTHVPDRRASLMFIAGANDHIVCPDEVQRLAARYPLALFWCAPTATHMGGIRLDRAEYERRVLDFLSDVLARRPLAEAYGA